MSRGAPRRTAAEVGVAWGAHAVEVKTSVAPAPPRRVLELLDGLLSGSV